MVKKPLTRADYEKLRREERELIAALALLREGLAVVEHGKLKLVPDEECPNFDTTALIRN